MKGSTLCRTGALLGSAALLASMTIATVAAPGSAKGKCTFYFPLDLAGYSTDPGDSNRYPGPYPITDDDNICGGAGNDVIDGVMEGGEFNGGAGDDYVAEMQGGTFNGNRDIDAIAVFGGGTFNGGPGADYVEVLYGTFNGGLGPDAVKSIFAEATRRGTFNGGPGDDTMTYMFGGTFAGGSGADEVQSYVFGDCYSVESSNDPDNC